MMRADIADWIERDADRARVYQTDALYHAQATVLSTMLDAVETSLEISLRADPEVVKHAMLAATTAVLGSIEAAETRAAQMQNAVKRATLGQPPTLSLDGRDH